MQSGERIVVHCSGGGGRAALGLGVWLCDKYGLTPEDAAAEV
jgi:protein-tyrosine phosphatase